MLDVYSKISFPLFSTESYVVTIRCNRLEETILTNGNNIEFG